VIGELQPDVVLVSHYANNVETSEAAPWNAGVDAFLDGAAANGAAVGWIHDIPANSFDPIECSARRSPEECSPGVAEATAWPNELRIRELPHLDRSGVLAIDPVEFMCDETCPLISNGTFNYRDHHHITASYASELAPFFEPFLRDLLDGETAAGAKASS